MKIVTKEQMNHVQLQSKDSGEVYSLSAVVSNLLGASQLFIHHDILQPQTRSSAAHCHSIVEEVVYIIKGQATIVVDGIERVAPEGCLIMLDPKDQSLHYVANKSEQPVETLTFSISNKFDLVTFENQKEESIEFPKFHFDADLKEVPDSIQELKSFCDSLIEKLKGTIPLERQLRCYEFLGVAKRIQKELSEAEAYLLKAVSLSQSYSNPSRLVQNLIRLANVYQWKGQFERAQVLFDQAGALIKENAISEVLVAAYHQHLGKFYFDQGLFEDAQAEFEVALSIRIKISAPNDQIESSQLALETVETRIQKT